MSVGPLNAGQMKNDKCALIADRNVGPMRIAAVRQSNTSSHRRNECSRLGLILVRCLHNRFIGSDTIGGKSTEFLSISNNDHSMKAG